MDFDALVEQVEEKALNSKSVAYIKLFAGAAFMEQVGSSYAGISTQITNSIAIDEGELFDQLNRAYATLAQSQSRDVDEALGQQISDFEMASKLLARVDAFQAKIIEQITNAKNKTDLLEAEAKLMTLRSSTFRETRFSPTQDFQNNLENYSDDEYKAILLRIAYYYFKKDEISPAALQTLSVPMAIRACCWSPYHSLHLLNLMNQSRLDGSDYAQLEQILLENTNNCFTRCIFTDSPDDQSQWLVNCSQHMPLYTKKLLKDFIAIMPASWDWRYAPKKKAKLFHSFERIYDQLDRTDQLDLYIALQDSGLHKEFEPKIHYSVPKEPEAAVADLNYLLTSKSETAKSMIARVCMEYKDQPFIQEYISHLYFDLFQSKGGGAKRLAQEFPFLKELDDGIIQAKQLLTTEGGWQSVEDAAHKFNGFELMLGTTTTGAKKQVLAESYLFKFGEPSNFYRTNRIVRLWSAAIVEQIGVDDGTEAYEKKFGRLIAQSMTHASPALKQIMYRQLAEAVQAQAPLANTLRPDAQSFNKDNLIGVSVVAKQVMNVLTLTGESYTRSQDILRFLISPYSDDRAEEISFHVRHWFPEMYVQKTRAISDFLDDLTFQHSAGDDSFDDNQEDEDGWNRTREHNDRNDDENEFEDADEDYDLDHEDELTYERETRGPLGKVFSGLPVSDAFRKKVEKLYPGDKSQILDPEHYAYFRGLHENFWSLPLELRAYVISELLIPAGKYAANATGATEEATRYASRQLFVVPDDADAVTKTRLIAGKEFMECYLDACHSGEKGLILSAVLAAQQKQDSSSLEQTVGKRLAAIVSELSPVEKKLAQAASFNPTTPEDIRNDLADITHQDKFPPRWELLSYMKEQVHPDVLQRVSRVNNVVGAASFYITLSYTRDDGEERVLSLLRPYARTHTINGFRRLYGGLQNYAERRPEYADGIAAVRSICQSAEQLCQQECDNHFCATVTHPLAYGVYAGKRFGFEGQRSIEMLPITWDAYGENWRDMPLAVGVHLKDIGDPVLAKDAAKSIAVDILSQCLSGRQFDCDRHTGQYLVDAKTRTVSCFDFGGFCAEPATPAELADISHAIEDALVHIKEQTGGESFDFSKLKLDLNNVQTAYGSRVQRGLLTLGSVTEAVKLSKADWQDVFVHVIKSKAIHPEIQQKLTDSVADVFGINKLLIKGALATQKTSIKLDRAAIPVYPMPQRLVSLNGGHDKSATATISKIVAQL